MEKQLTPDTCQDYLGAIGGCTFPEGSCRQCTYTHTQDISQDMEQLTTSDRQRIEQFADGKDRRLTSYHKGLQDGAEYATLYERRQLRNKVIEELVKCIEGIPLRTSGVHERTSILHSLNSLKTK